MRRMATPLVDTVNSIVIFLADDQEYNLFYDLHYSTRIKQYVVNENHCLPVRHQSQAVASLQSSTRQQCDDTRTPGENRSHKNFTMMCRRLGFLVTTLLLVLAVVGGQRYDQGYDEYSQDNLYHDYAMKQQDKDAKP